MHAAKMNQHLFSQQHMMTKAVCETCTFGSESQGNSLMH